MAPSWNVCLQEDFLKFPVVDSNSLCVVHDIMSSFHSLAIRQCSISQCAFPCRQIFLVFTNTLSLAHPENTYIHEYLCRLKVMISELKPATFSQWCCVANGSAIPTCERGWCFFSLKMDFVIVFHTAYKIGTEIGYRRYNDTHFWSAK